MRIQNGKTGCRMLAAAAALFLYCTCAWLPAMPLHETKDFSLRYPEDWILETNEQGQILLTGTEGEEIGIWPMYSRRVLSHKALESLLLGQARRNLPDLQWQAPQSIGRNALRVLGDSDDVHAVAMLGWQKTRKGMAMTYYLVVGPEAAFERKWRLYSDILASFHARGHAKVRGRTPAGRSSRKAASLRYVRWTDPMEGMFSMEVPRGWTVQGGTYRASAIDVRPWIEVVSPGGGIRVFSGDVRIPTFTEPNQIMWMNGNGEGTWYDPGFGTRMFVLRYRPGLAFLEYYLPQWSDRCEILEGRDRQDVVEAESRIRARWGMPVMHQDDAGEAKIRCRGEKGVRVGYVFVQTRRLQGYGVSLWQVPRLMGYLAPAGKEDLAREILSHMVRTTRINLDWLRSQQQTTGQVSEIVRDTSRYISDVIDKGYRHTQAIQDRSAEKWSRAFREVERVQDPRTGTTYVIQSGSEYAWIDAKGNIVGTRTQANPDGLRFEKMIRLDR